jgi:hypothetical protein
MQVDSKVPKQLKKFLKKNCGEDKLAVVDPKLGKAIASKLGLEVTSGAEISELTRGIRSQMEGLVSSLDQQSMTQMSLGLSHSLSRYKLKFSPDKIDTMVVQAIGLLDELDKELNTYSMRVREWYVSAHGFAPCNLIHKEDRSGTRTRARAPSRSQSRCTASCLKIALEAYQSTYRLLQVKINTFQVSSDTPIGLVLFRIHRLFSACDLLPFALRPSRR